MISILNSISLDGEAFSVLQNFIIWFANPWDYISFHTRYVPLLNSCHSTHSKSLVWVKFQFLFIFCCPIVEVWLVSFIQILNQWRISEFSSLFLYPYYFSTLFSIFCYHFGWDDRFSLLLGKSMWVDDSNDSIEWFIFITL